VQYFVVRNRSTREVHGILAFESDVIKQHLEDWKWQLENITLIEFETYQEFGIDEWSKLPLR